MIEAGHPDLLQFHGNETPDHVATIKARFGLRVIKSIAIETLDDLKQCANWDGVADWLLFDAKAESGAQPGGTKKASTGLFYKTIKAGCLDARWRIGSK